MHGTRRANCRDCGGSNFCKHDKHRQHCRVCGGSSYCKHDKRRDRCKECGGTGFCKHDKLRYVCKECGGSGLCKHDRKPTFCAECQNLPCTMEGCPQFGHRFSSARKLLQHMRAFHSGQPRALTKSKELSVYRALQTAGISFEYQKHLPFHG